MYFCPSLFHDGGRYHIETSPLICSANQWTGFSMIRASVMKELTIKSEKNFDLRIRKLESIINLKKEK